MCTKKFLEGWGSPTQDRSIDSLDTIGKQHSQHTVIYCSFCIFLLCSYMLSIKINALKGNKLTQLWFCAHSPWQVHNTVV